MVGNGVLKGDSLNNLHVCIVKSYLISYGYKNKVFFKAMNLMKSLKVDICNETWRTETESFFGYSKL